MKTLTIFTPAYNRAHTIGRTYESLCRQSSKDFIWLVIDDGSTDSTKTLIEEFIAESKIEIHYIWQQNQGMHGAHNTAYRNIHTELNVCIDSDDYMPDDAVEKILTLWKAKGSEQYAGLIGLDQKIDGGIIGTQFRVDQKETTLYGFYAQGGKGDKKLVYRTDVIRRYPEYPIFEGEKYVGLAYKYHLIDLDFHLLTSNEVFCIVEYQEDGSSKNMYKQYWNNPNGFAFYRKAEMKISTSIYRRFVVCVHYVSSSVIAGNRKFIKDSPLKVLTLCSILPGYILSRIIKYKVIKNSLLKV